MQSYVDSLKDANLSAYVHVQEGYVCLDCHELAVLEDVHKDADLNATSIKALRFPKEFCLSCHGSYSALIKLTTDSIAFEDPEGNYINPHEQPSETHTENVECYSCHKMHKTYNPINYCYGCHHAGVLECGTCH